ncbi:TetR/AcrR family transcriptional regulator [Actinokineospora fastidiosa]|uniref:TetR family transcriptional regulator n=1 Tax=Actinokineospora fastidiosa TaxID=1816 RepID=A0A918GBV0_9PSEU|nr:TetR/AcrR family transcriptional regulator [Actinokineospora fastidiosa]GGS27932.1 TetR family transcriptional regulator [Actinokineospora fastidiosa]
MRHNPTRRTALLDAAIDVLARDGARGLTFRAVDTHAAVPTGTASNYFTNRDDLLTQVAHRVYERLTPDAPTMAAVHHGPRDHTTLTRLMHELVDRVTAFPSGHLALLELRLEATRRPHLRDLLTTRIRADVDANITTHIDSGLPGDATTVELLYLALNWLILERLTLPDVFPDPHHLVTELVRRLA